MKKAKRVENKEGGKNESKEKDRRKGGKDTDKAGRNGRKKGVTDKERKLAVEKEISRFCSLTCSLSPVIPSCKQSSHERKVRVFVWCVYEFQCVCGCLFSFQCGMPVLACVCVCVCVCVRTESRR